MSSQNKKHLTQREIEVVRKTGGWSIKVTDPNPETRHRPLSKEEREVVREDVKRGASVEAG
jgi:hypothetical protein